MKTHRMSRSQEYRIWIGMRERCTNPNHMHFRCYGGRGIRVCDRWIHSFPSFFSDMGRRPSPEHSLDRIDADGDYEPSNCRWATHAQQAASRRNVRRISIGEVTLTMAGWSVALGGEKSLVGNRIRSGWDAVSAATTPVGGRR